MSVTEPLKLRSRRALLAGVAGAAGTAVVAGCGGKPLREKVRAGASVARADIPALNALLDAENYGIAAYAAGIPLLSVAQAAIGKQFLSQELAHAVELSDFVKAAGGKPRRRPVSYDLGHPRTEAEALALLEKAERLQLEAYLKTIPTLSGGHVKGALAAIFSNDAQHLAVLRLQAGKSLPGAFSL